MYFLYFKTYIKSYFISFVKSEIRVTEVQTEKGLPGSKTTIYVGISDHENEYTHHQNMRAELSLGSASTVFLDTPPNTLVAWSVVGPEHQRHTPYPDRNHDVAPFYGDSKLLKTVHFKF